MSAKENKKSNKPSVAEIFLFSVVVIALVGIGVSAILRYRQQRTNGGDLLSRAQAAFSANGEEAIGTEFLPSSGILVYDLGDKQVRLTSETSVKFLSAREEKGKVLVRLSTSRGTSLLAAYSQTFVEDLRQIQTLPDTARLLLQTEGLERKAIEWLVYSRYGNACFLEEGKAWRYTEEGKVKEEFPATLKTAFVCDVMREEYLPYLRSMSLLSAVHFADLGDFRYEDGSLYRAGGGILAYAMPFTERVECPRETYGFDLGCLQNAKGITFLSIPYVGKSVSYLFNGSLPKNLKTVVFSSSITGDLPEEVVLECEGLSVVKLF